MNKWIFFDEYHIAGIPQDKQIVESKESSDVESFGAKVAGIKEVLARDHMKVVLIKFKQSCSAVQ